MTAAVTMTEQELLDATMELAKILKWRTAHFRPARTAHGWATAVSGDGKGFPDLILVRDRLVAIEFKAAKGKLTPEQVAWRDAFTVAGIEWHEFRPVHWLDGTITDVLRRRS
jgi:hypothetical protein